TKEAFPYTMRLVSEILSQNGSSSMASVCGSSLSLMDADVKITKPVAGIAMGLVWQDEQSYAILSDIQGMEDFCGDMDFKVAGTRDGITALQMDIKIKGLTPEIMAQALEQARAGRMHILAEMSKALSEPRPNLSPYAPKIVSIRIDPEKIRDVIGSGGKVINKIIQETGVEIDIEDDGLVMIASVDDAGIQKAITIIQNLTAEAEVGKIYSGKVTRIMNFGAFVEILPGKEGLVHISNLAPFRVNKVEDIVKIGETISVKVVEIDSQGRVNLSKKAADAEQAQK
ncbi:MAG TPA: S1 RNA-binding domain-containing protein, partial [bacterium]|nr:S1 RNA-binding domain-containing protein [bacterium]